MRMQIFFSVFTVLGKTWLPRNVRNLLINEATSNNPGNLLLLGDFNYKEIDWSSARSNTQPSQPAHKFLTTCENAYLLQNQTEPTRYRTGQEPSFLGRVLTNRDETINEITTEAGLGENIHVTIVINLSWSCKQSLNDPFNYQKADFQPICNFLQP